MGEYQNWMGYCAIYTSKEQMRLTSVSHFTSVRWRRVRIIKSMKGICGVDAPLDQGNREEHLRAPIQEVNHVPRTIKRFNIVDCLSVLRQWSNPANGSARDTNKGLVAVVASSTYLHVARGR